MRFKRIPTKKQRVLHHFRTPAGIAPISRGLREAIPPVCHAPTASTPAGCASRAAATPDGVGTVGDLGTGGIASLNPRLIALNPPGSITRFITPDNGSKDSNIKGDKEPTAPCLLVSKSSSSPSLLVSRPPCLLLYYFTPATRISLAGPKVTFACRPAWKVIS